MAYSITSANSTIILGVANLLPLTPIVGYTADDIFTADAIDNAETVMGLDGFMSAGWVPVAVRVNFMLMANSPSIGFFETLYGAEQQSREKYTLFGSITVPSLGRSYNGAKGFLRNYQPLANAARTMQPRSFSIDWESLPGIAVS